MGTLRRRRFLAAAVAGAMAAVPSTASVATAAPPAETASVVSDWNAIAITTLSGDTGKVAQEHNLYMAFVHAAVYDAVVAVHPRYEPYRWHGGAPRNTSATAAAAAAAHKILVTYSPYAQAALDTALATSLAGIPDGDAKTRGVVLGERVAQRFIDLRANDGRNAAVTFDKAPAPGIWRPTLPAFAPMAVPWLGRTTPLLKRSTTQFLPGRAPALTSARYTSDFNEVKAYGSATSTVRSAEQTATARFFSGNAVVQVNAALRDQAAVRRLNIVDAARMFAAVDLTVSDSFSTSWLAKLVYGQWRPITAIQLADTDGNPATTPDPAWLPLLNTPPYPDWVSGYNSAMGAASRALEDIFGKTGLNLTLISTAVPGEVRHYDSGAAVRAEVVDARIWLGIHFRSSDTAARDMAITLADWVACHYFRPTGRTS